MRATMSLVSDGVLPVELSRNMLPSALHATPSVREPAIADGLEIAEVSLSGQGPFPPLPTNAEKRTDVDCIAMHRTPVYYVGTVVTRLGIMTPDIWTVKADNRRPAMALYVGVPHYQESYSGALPQTSIRREAWAIGDYSRSRGVLDDAERVYDPGARRDTVRAAYDDLRCLGVGDFRQDYSDP